MGDEGRIGEASLPVASSAFHPEAAALEHPQVAVMRASDAELA